MKTIMMTIILLSLQQAEPADYITVDPDRLSMSPSEYVGVPIKLKCRFLKQDSTWLDDSGVFKSSQKFIGLIVQAGDRIFAQLFYPRDRIEQIERLESNDRLIIYGRVFSSRYNFPWIDVEKISEGWVVGEEPEKVREERIKMARDYEDFLKARSKILKELKLDDVRDIFFKQEALIELLIEKKVFTRREFEQQYSLQKAKPTPAPLWEIIMQER